MFRWHVGATGEEWGLKEGERATSTQNFLSAHSGALWQLTSVEQQLDNRRWTRKVIIQDHSLQLQFEEVGRKCDFRELSPWEANLHSMLTTSALCCFVLELLAFWKVDRFYSLWWTNNKNAIHFWVPFRGFESSLPWPHFLLVNVWDHQPHCTEAYLMDRITGLVSNSCKTRNPGLHFYYNKENVYFSET